MAAVTYPISAARHAELLENYHFRVKGGMHLHDGDEDEREAFAEVVGRLLSREVEEGRLNPGQQNRARVVFNFQMGTAWYKHPDTDQKIVIDLLDLGEGELKGAVDAYIQEVGMEKFLSRAKQFRARCKGNQAAKNQPLDRSTPNLRALPNGDEYAYDTLMPRLLQQLANRDDRIVVATRLHVVEFNRRKMLQNLEERIKDKDEELIDLAEGLHAHPENNKPIGVLREEISRLREERVEIEQLDYYALGHQLAAYPLDGSQPISLTEETLRPMLEAKLNEIDGQYRAELRKSPPDQDRVKQLEQEVQHLRGLVHNIHRLNIYQLTKELSHYPLDDFWLQDLAPVRVLVQALEADIRSKIADHKGKGQKLKELIHISTKQDLSEDEIGYILDVVGMLYTTRWDYQDYCQQNHMPMKKEGIADILLREAVAYTQDEDAYDGEGFALSTLGECFDRKFFDDMARLAYWEIVDPEDKWYKVPRPPAGLPDDAQKQWVHDQEEKLSKDLKAQRDAINWDSTVEDIPEDAPEPGFLESNRGRIALAGCGALAAGGAAYAAGALPEVANVAIGSLAANGWGLLQQAGTALANYALSVI